MNKYIKTDIEQGLKYLKVGIMNALADIESGEEDEISLDGPIALSFIIKCAEERGWIEDPDMDWDWTNGWEVDFWCPVISPSGKSCIIDGSLWGQTYSIRVDNE